GVGGAVGFAAAPGGEEEKQRSEEARQIGPPHDDQRGAGVGGAGAAGAAGADPAGAGAAAGGGAASRTTELPRSPPRIASVNDVIVKTIAMPVVILPSKVGVPIDPNTAWLPAPPNAEPMSAPFPDCSRTMPMMAKHARTCRMVRAMYIRSLLRRGADARRLANDPDEPLRVEAGAADEGSVHLGLRQQRVGVLGLDAAAIQDTDGLRDFLRRELGQEPAKVRLHLGGLRGCRVDARADRPHRLVGKDGLGDLVGPEPGQAGAQLSLDGRERQPLASLVRGLADAEHGCHPVG